MLRKTFWLSLKSRAGCSKRRRTATDPRIRQAFKAKSYGGVIALRGASLIEYSIGNLIRVIAKAVENRSAGAGEPSAGG